MKNKAQLLERRVKLAKLRSLIFAGGAAAALLLGMIFWYAYYASSVLSYAELDVAIRVERSAVEPDRLTLFYRPVRAGKVGFRRLDKNRETELLDRVSPGGAADEKFEWRWNGVQVGDVVKVTFRDGWSLTTKELRVPEAPQAPPLGDAKLTGEVVNATDGKPVPDAKINVVGTSLTTRTNAEGKFELSEAPAGIASIEVSARNFSAEQFDQELTSGANAPLRVVLSPGMQAGQIRLVLTWGSQLPDLDVHLQGPLPNGQRFHVFHKQKGDLKSKEFVNLDVDDRDGEGPETITVLGVLPGQYHLFIHNASSEEGTSSDKRDLARSGAEVKIYQGGQTYRFSANRESEGNIWRICDIDVSAVGAAVRKIDTYEFATTEEEGAFAKRTRGNRSEWIGHYGGGANSEVAVAAGLAWLARHQAEDGHWGPGCLQPGLHSRCEKDHRCTGPGQQFDAALTGLALLAFQAGGNYYDNNKPYSENVRRGLDWLVKHQREDGALVSPTLEPRHHYFMYEHGIAAFALAEACAVGAASHHTIDPQYRAAAEKAIRFIERQQHLDGGWRYTENRNEASDTSISGWQVLALKSAKEAKINVSQACLTNVESFFDHCQIGHSGRTSYTAGGGQITEATTGVGMLVQEFLLGKNDSPLVTSGAEHLANLAEQSWKAKRQSPLARSTDYYLWYNCTLAMFQAGGQPWKRWNDVVRDTIIDLQNKDESLCARGSWEPNDQWSQAGGRVYSTALAVLSLEVYYRYSSERAKVYADLPVPQKTIELNR